MSVTIWSLPYTTLPAESSVNHPVNRSSQIVHSATYPSSSGMRMNLPSSEMLTNLFSLEM